MPFLARRTALAASVALAFAPAIVLAAPPAGTPYHTDTQESFVWDQTAEAIGTVNMITCIMDALNPDELINRGPYAALVDEKKCDSNKASASNSGATAGGGAAAPQYMRGMVNATRASNDEPMRARVWFDQEEGGQSQTIFVNLSATAGPSATNPYGVFRVDYCGTSGAGQPCNMNGMVSAGADGIRYVETEEGGTYTRQLYLTRSGDTGAGAVRSTQTGNPDTTYRFAYGPTHFMRTDGTTPACFDRRLDQAKTSIWRYGLYDAAGNRLERNSGFPIKFTEGGQTWFGYAGYYGLNLPPDGMAALTTGDSVVKQNFGENATEQSYTVMKSKGRLVKHTRQTATLGEMTGLKFTFQAWNGLTNTTANAIKSGEDGNSIRPRQLEAYYESGKFWVSGYLDCTGGSGCTVAATASPVELTSSDLAPYAAGPGLMAFAQSFGGNLHLDAGTLAAPSGSSVVAYRTQDLVYPGAAGAPTALSCVNNCPSASSIAAFIANTNPTPFGTTANQWGPTGTSVSYTVNGTTGELQAGGQAAVVADGVSEDDLTGQYRWGIRSGRLVENLADLDCPGMPGQSCESMAESLPVFYTWETGPSAWNQFAGLRDGTGAFLRFDPPLQVTFNVPADGARYGQYAGSSMRLDYGGFGELNGIPGNCVDANTNEPTDCAGGGNNKRYVPSFSIPFDPTTGVVTAGGQTYYVKWLNREVRFNRVSTATAACVALAPSMGSLSSLPQLSEAANPSSPADALYIGTKPTVTTAPRVVHGVTMY